MARKSKGGAPGGTGGGRVTPKASTRYTPPIPREMKVSPRWLAPVMFALLGGGMVVILLNYLGVLPGGAKNTYLLIGLGLITLGFIAATRYR